MPHFLRVCPQSLLAPSPFMSPAGLKTQVHGRGHPSSCPLTSDIPGILRKCGPGWQNSVRTVQDRIAGNCFSSILLPVHGNHAGSHREHRSPLKEPLRSPRRSNGPRAAFSLFFRTPPLFPPFFCSERCFRYFWQIPQQNSGIETDPAAEFSLFSRPAPRLSWLQALYTAIRPDDFTFS